MNSKEPIDIYWKQAFSIVKETGKASESLIQRRLKLGYTHASLIIKMMENKGLISPPQWNQYPPRQIFLEKFPYLQ